MSSSWSDISLETAACLLIAVVAYKLYRMKFAAESECCGGAVTASAQNPGNGTPRALRGILGSDRGEVSGGEDIELGLTIEQLDGLRKSRLVRTTNEERSVVGISTTNL